MKVSLLLFPAVMLFSGVLIAQDDELPAPSSHPTPPTLQTPLPEPKPPDCPLLTRYARANQLKYIIEPDIDFGVVNRQLNIGLAPAVGHKIYKGLYGGAGLVYIYSGNRNVLLADVSGRLYYTNAYIQTYGAGVFLQYNVWKGLYLRIRFDLLHRQIDNLANATVMPNPKTGNMQVYMPVIKLNIPDLPVGIGYNILVSKNLFLPIKLSYNLLYPFLNKQYTVYPNGWIVKICVFNIF